MNQIYKLHLVITNQQSMINSSAQTILLESILNFTC